MTDKKNYKKILCMSIIKESECNYGSKCRFAHSLNEQCVEPMRHKIYTILKNKKDLKNIDLINDQKLYDGLIKLTKLCRKCASNRCTGGYNCREGACSIKYVVCYRDLLSGNCNHPYCDYIHLTDRGLVSYNEQLKTIEDYSTDTEDEVFTLSKGLLYRNLNDNNIESSSDMDEEELHDFINYLDNSDSDTDISL